MTYTEHKLTDAQLRRLSAIKNGTKGAAMHGNAGAALIRKGLVAYDGIPCSNCVRPTECREYGCHHRLALKLLATDAGATALAQARAEGW